MRTQNTNRTMTIVALVAALALGACAAAVPYGLLEGGSLMATDKGFSDHVMSLASGKDCSVLNKQHGQAYCVEDQKGPDYRDMYCYKTLGKVTCYDRRDERYDRVDRDEHHGNN